MAASLNNNNNDNTVPDIDPFYDNLHTTYITTLGDKLDAPTSYEGAVTEHLRMSGVYWSLAGLSILRNVNDVDTLMGLTSCDRNDRPAIIDWVFACYDKRSGGFGGNCSGSISSPTCCPHDGHLLYTLSALQILAMANALDDERLDKDAIVKFVSKLQNDDGSFSGDEWGEVDTRFSYCALSCLALLGRLPLPKWAAVAVDEEEEEAKANSNDTNNNEEEDAPIDINKAVYYIISCRNFDGGFGCVPGAESHAGQVFCCIGALSIAHSLHLLNDAETTENNNNNEGADLLAWWLAERQCDSGGLNGRPEKQADVCYSWWILSALSIMGRVSWINTSSLGQFILNCQDSDDGGIADRPNDMPDVYHTFFGLCGLSLIGHMSKIGDKEGRVYRKVDPVFALPSDVVQRLNLRAQVISDSKGLVEERLNVHSIFHATKKL